MKWYSINSIVTAAHQLRVEGFIDVSHDLLMERLQKLNAAHLPNGADSRIPAGVENTSSEAIPGVVDEIEELWDDTPQS